MKNRLVLYNTLSRKKEQFEPINPPFVGLYVCGPTVYGDAHLGHARPAITFDLLFRYLKYLGYKVRYAILPTTVTTAKTKSRRKRSSTGWNRWKSFSFIPTATITIWSN